MTSVNNTTVWEPGPVRLLNGIISAPIQWLTAVRRLRTGRLLKAATLEEQARVRSLGVRIYENNVGDQFLREKVTSLMRRWQEAGLPEATRAEIRADLDRQRYLLGCQSLDALVPMLTACKEHDEAKEARDRLRTLEARDRELVARVWPGTTLGWFGLFTSYALVVALAGGVIVAAAAALSSPGPNAPTGEAAAAPK